MDTYGLILQALEAKASYKDAETNAALPAGALAEFKTLLDAANLALHDDLAANGPAVMVNVDDESSATLYSSQDPDTYTTTPLRVA